RSSDLHNGEAIYGTHAWKSPRQWSAGNVPKMEEKEFRAAYDIHQMVDAPPAGNARVEAFLTAKGDSLYALVPRRPLGEVTIDGVQGFGRVTLLGRNEPLSAQLRGGKLAIAVPERLAASLPDAEAYTFHVAG